MAKFLMTPTIHKEPVRTVRLGTLANKYRSTEIGKAVKLTGESQFELASAGDAIEAIISSSLYSDVGGDNYGGGTQDGFAIGGVYETGYFPVLFTDTVVVGDYIVAAAQPALGTRIANSDLAAPVQKAADQDAAKAAPFKARIVSLGEAGTGLAGTIGLAKFL